MRITVEVRASDTLKRTYTIEVGHGTQYISWLAQTACLKFGQDHYPPGVYVPTLLSKEQIEIAAHMPEDADIPHPRYVTALTQHSGVIQL
jgi:hypothetical protein